ncbi:MAG TPA: laminin B domain-containing protein [Solirubrobacterales bacterium]|nr:laminin B domain-containing protein [Solirubrobacterales bacterium]
MTLGVRWFGGVGGVLALVACVGVTASSADATVGLRSTFDTSTQGWTPAEIADPFEWRAGGGNPGGHITSARGTGGTAGADSPSSWAGNRSTAYGGTISFDIRLDPGIVGQPLEVILDSSNPGIGDLWVSFGSVSIPDWERRVVRLAPSPQWNREGSAPVNRTAFEEVLGSLGRVRIAAGLAQTDDRIYFDNITLASDVKRSLTLKRRAKRFFGKLRPLNPCAKRQKVTIFRKRGGPDAKLKTVRTDARGEYGFRAASPRRGRYYASAARSFAAGGGNCLAARSKTVAVG